MWKLLFTSLIIAVASTSSIPTDDDYYCKENFHKICVFHGVLAYVKQRRCNDKTFVSMYDKYYCQEHKESSLTLYLEDYSTIISNVFSATNFTTFQLISRSRICDRKHVISRPESFAGLSSVRYLTLDCAEFSSTPNLFKEFESVDVLTLSRMEFTGMPENFLSDLPELNEFILKKVNITVISPVTFSGINVGLKYLYLESNNLAIVKSRSFQKLHNLQQLTIKDNDLTNLQSDIFNGLDALDTLNLERNGITVLHMNILKKLPKLRAVYLMRNNICRIQIGSLPRPLMEILDLSYNDLEDLPVEGFKDFPNLRILSLDNNKISILQRNVFPRTLRHLTLAHNDIHQIEPAAFWGLNLQHLHLDHNKLSVIEPNTFNGLHLDEGLMLTCNYVSEVKEQAFKNLTAAWIAFSTNMYVMQGDSWQIDNSVEFLMEISAECWKPN